MAALVAARADEVEAVQAGVAGDGREVAPGPALVPHAVSARAGPRRASFFSATSAWACRAASTALRVSSRPAWRAKASTLERTWLSVAESAVCSSWRASSGACSGIEACNGVSASNVRRFMGNLLGDSTHNTRAAAKLPESIHAPRARWPRSCRSSASRRSGRRAHPAFRSGGLEQPDPHATPRTVNRLPTSLL